MIGDIRLIYAWVFEGLRFVTINEIDWIGYMPLSTIRVEIDVISKGKLRYIKI